MGANQQKNIDLSNYSEPKKTAAYAKPSDLDREKKKNKIYLIIIAVCVFLGIIFWIMFFGQNMKNNAAVGARDAETGELLPIE